MAGAGSAAATDLPSGSAGIGTARGVSRLGFRNGI